MQKSSLQTVCQVVAPYQCSNANPIVLRPGEHVKVGREFTEDPDWPGWIWCENAAGQGGWVPRRLIGVSGPEGTARAAYTARELSVQPKEILTVERILNGWAWARRGNGETGWVPMRNLKPQTSIKEQRP